MTSDYLGREIYDFWNNFDMIFSYNWLQSFFKKKPRSRTSSLWGRLPKPEKLVELLSMHAFEVEKIEKVGKDWILDIDVLPNRGPDCFSHIGIAREIGTITNLKYIGPTYVIKENTKTRAKDFVSVEVKDKTACPRYTARVITNVKVSSSPKWIQERLRVCGLRPINNIVDIANYVMLETGQPIHAFDLDKVSGVQNQKSNSKEQKFLIVRQAQKDEKIITLENQKYTLDQDILIIADLKGPLAIAGIKGGKKAEIDKKTKIVVLESANFNRRVIRKGSQKIGLKTDASWRFEHGINQDLTESAINRAAYLIQEISDGEVLQGLIDFYPEKILPKRIKLDLDYVERLLGVRIPAGEIKNILKRLNFKIIKISNSQLLIEVPTFRLDISLPEDLIEEIGRIYGYDKIKAAFPMAVLIPPKRNLDIFWEDNIKNILKEVGFSEVYNYSFIGEKDSKILKYKANDLIEIENPISLEQKYLRPSLIPNLLRNIEKNQTYFKEIKIFELGKTFKKIKTKTQNSKLEKRMLCGVMTGDMFYLAKGVVDLLLNKLGISNIWYDEYQPTPEESIISIWQPKKCAEIKVNQEEIGFLGEISPRILENLKIDEKVAVFDIDFEKLSVRASEEQEYRPISRFPAAIRDLAVLVPREVRMEEVLNKIEISGGKLIIDIDLFDIYEGEELPEGKKNLAFHIIYQAENRTLSSKEIDEIQNKIIKALEEEPEWQVRK